MFLRQLLATAALSTSLLAAIPAFAQDYLVGYGGYFDLVQQKDEAGIGGIEYRFSPVAYGIRPVVGAAVTTDSGKYAYAGLSWDVALTDKIMFVPNFAAGAWSNGDGRDLGGAIEFRSGVGFSYLFDNRHRVGIDFSHISNASIYDKNPGTEILSVNYGVPISW